MEIGIISEKGLRPTMEDAHFLDIDFCHEGWIYLGIYDGHGGNYAAKYTAERLHEVVLRRLDDGYSSSEAFIVGYETVSRELGSQTSGTTAVDILIQGKRLVAANAGDGRAIVVRVNSVTQLTVDHRLNNPEEAERVGRAGGLIEYPYITKGTQGLMPTRSIGDEYFKEVGVVATPSTREYILLRDDLMLISACDGLWDFMDNEEVASMARENPDPTSLLDVLKQEVLVNRLGTDNLTIIAVSL